MGKDCFEQKRCLAVLQFPSGLGSTFQSAVTVGLLDIYFKEISGTLFSFFAALVAAISAEIPLQLPPG